MSVGPQGAFTGPQGLGAIVPQTAAPVGVSQTTDALLGPDATTSSIVFSPLLSRTITSTGAGFLLIWASWSFSSDPAQVSATTQLVVRVLVDGVTPAPIGTALQADTNGNATGISLRVPTTVGLHTITLEWRVAVATMTARIRPTTVPDLEHASIVVAESVN